MNNNNSPSGIYDRVPHSSPADMNTIAGGGGMCGGPPPDPRYLRQPISPAIHRPAMAPLSGGHVPMPTSSMGFNKAAAWTNNHFGDSGLQSMNPSAAQSFISVSTIHHSQMSAIGSQADESLAPELSIEQQMKFENIPVCQLVDQVDRVAQRRAMNELMPLLSDDDEVVVQHAVMMVDNVAKMEEDNTLGDPIINNVEILLKLNELLRTRQENAKIVRYVLSALFHISNRPGGVELLMRMIRHTNGEFYVDLIRHIGRAATPNHRFAVLLLHTLMAQPMFGAETVAFLRRNGAMQAIVKWLEIDPNEKTLNIAVSCIKLLCSGSAEEKKRLLDFNGIPKLIHIFQRYQYEKLLFTTVEVLSNLSNAYPEVIANAGGFEVLHLHLEHASHRLVISSLKCIRNICDCPCRDRDMRPLISKLMQLIGTQDLLLRSYCVGILCNVPANNVRNKEFLYQHNAVQIMIRVIMDTGARQTDSHHEMELVEEIEECAIRTLTHLCVGHTYAKIVHSTLLYTPHVAELLLHKLSEKRPQVIRSTLLLLNNLAKDDNNLPAFRDVQVQPRQCPAPTTYAEQLVNILRAACNIAKMEFVEEVKVVDLLHFTMATLMQLCNDRVLLNQVCHFLHRIDFLVERKVFLPVYTLQCCADDNVRRSALGLLSQMAAHPETARTFANDQYLMSAFEHFSLQRNSQADATYASKAIQRVMHGGEMVPLIRYKPPPQPQTIPYQQPPSGYPNGHVPYPNGGAPPQPMYAQHCPQPHMGQQMPMQQQQHSQMNVVPPPQPPSHHQQVLPYNGNPGGEIQHAMLANYGDQGSSTMPGGDNDDVCAMDGPWPDDLSGLTLQDDPFANPFVNVFNDASHSDPQHVPPRPYSSASTVPLGSSMSAPGVQNPPPLHSRSQLPSYDVAPQMEGMHLGSPDSSWDHGDVRSPYGPRYPH